MKYGIKKYTENSMHLPSEISSFKNIIEEDLYKVINYLFKL